MLENIKEFRSAISDEKIVDVMEAIADFGDEMAVTFGHEFPDLPNDEYTRTEAWHMLIGSTLPADFKSTSYTEVEEWMMSKVEALIATL
jgi:hypothetical protein